MIMVTHDPNIKRLAHRAVYVMDGKINRVESIPPAHRAEFIDKLRQDVEVQLSLVLFSGPFSIPPSPPPSGRSA